MKKIVSLLIILTISAISCKKDDDQKLSDADKFVGRYECVTGDFLEISKKNDVTIHLNFIHGTEINSVWNHSFVATVEDTSLTIDKQYWYSEQMLVWGHGWLNGDVLTIDFYYDNFSPELGLVYNRLN